METLTWSASASMAARTGPASGRPQRTIPVTPGWNSGWPLTCTRLSAGPRASSIAAKTMTTDRRRRNCRQCARSTFTGCSDDFDLGLEPGSVSSRRIHGSCPPRRQVISSRTGLSSYWLRQEAGVAQAGAMGLLELEGIRLVHEEPEGPARPPVRAGIPHPQVEPVLTPSGWPTTSCADRLQPR